MGIDLAPPELTTTQVLKTYGSYKTQKIPPNQGIGTQTVGPASYVWIDFEFPASVYNFHKSYVGYNVKNNTELKDIFTWRRQDCHALITAVRMKAIDGSAPFIDIPYHPQYQKIFLPREIDADKAFTRSQRNKCFVMGSENKWSSAGTAIQKANGGNYGVITPAWRGADDGKNDIPLMPLEVVQAISDLKGIDLKDDADSQEYEEFPLSDLKQTICDYVGDFYAGQKYLLSLQFGPTTYYKWTTTGAGGDVNPTIGAANAISSTVISQPFLYLAVQNNLAVANDVRATFLAKGKLALPYVHCIKQAMGSNNSISANFSVSASYGTHIKLISFSLYNGTESKNTALDNSNIVIEEAKFQNSWVASKLQSYRTNFGPEPLQYYDVRCDSGTASGGAIAARSSGPGEDWALNKPLLEGKLFPGPMAYRENHHHTDYFCGTKLSDVWKDREVAGRALAPDPVSWGVFGQTATTGCNMFIFVVFIRWLTVSERAPATFM